MATYAISNLAREPVFQPGSVGNYRLASKLATATGTYTTGGDTISAEALGLRRIVFGFVNVHTPDADVAVADGVLVPQANGNALVKLNGVSAEATNGGTITGLVLQVIAFGDA